MAFIARTLDGVDCWVYDGPGRAIKAAPKIIELLGIPFPKPGEMIEWPSPAQVAAAPEPTAIEKTCNTCKWDHRIYPQGPEKNAHCAPCYAYSNWEPIENTETGKKFDDGFNAPYFLLTGAKLLEERGRHYDSGQERSMKKAVEVFNTLTGYSITETQGWLFMQCVKLVRQQTAKGFHQDSYEDDIAYAALKAESAAKEAEK